MTSDVGSASQHASSGWQNWSGSLPPSKAALVEPRNTAELQQLIRTAEGPVRPVGSGHSWPALVPNDHRIVALTHFNHIGDIDRASKRAWIGAGAKLHDASPQLAAHGLAFRNLGDIDVQTLAGSTSTGTHGTGQDLPALHAEITGLRLVTGSGDEMEISQQHNADLLDGARIALGSLGVLTEIEMQLVERHKLRRTAWAEKHDDLLARAMQLWADNRNFEFFYIPFSGYSFGLTHNIVDEEDTPRAPDTSDDEVMQLKALRDWLGWWPAARKFLLSRAIAGSQMAEDVIGESWQLLSSQRNVLFNEMEYHLPVERGLQALEEIRFYIERDRRDVFFPFEARCTKGDTGWLSPFQGGDRISIAVHCYYKDAYEFLFSHVEPIFRKHGGRPHWGKMNSLSHAEAQELYPDFDKFNVLRRQLDPHGRMLNPHLAKLFGEQK